MGIICGWLLFVGYSARADCPTIKSYQGWVPNSTVGYFIVGGFDAPESSQVDTAMQSWTDHNVNLWNCSLELLERRI